MTSAGLQQDIDISHLEELLKGIEASPRMMNEEIHLAMRLALELTQKQVTGHMGIDNYSSGINTGALRSSIHNMVIRRGNTMTGKIGTSRVYGLPVERGRAAGRWPPREAIKYWVVRKMGLPADDPQTDSIAFLIQRAIGKGTSRGIHGQGKGVRMFERGFDASIDPVKKLFGAVPGKVIRRIQNA